MKLNEYLHIVLGVEFSNKINSLAVQEIIENEEDYPNLYPIFKEIVDDLEYEGKSLTNNYDFSYFEFDDPEFNADHRGAYELNKAMTVSFLNSLKDKPFTLSSVSYGIGYLKSPYTAYVINHASSYNGIRKVTFFSNTTICKESMYKSNGSIVFCGEQYFKNNKDVLRNIKNNIRNIGNYYELFEQRFSDDELASRAVDLNEFGQGYEFDFYEVCINGYLIKFLTTERGFEALGATFRCDIQCSFTDEERQNPILHNIFGF